MAGGVSVHLLMRSADVNVTLSDCVMIILDSKERWDNFQAVAEIHPGGRITCVACSSLKVAIAVDSDSRPANALLVSELMAEIKDREDLIQLPNLDPEDLAIINQTSGTTGIPKKVCHSHFNAINNFSVFCNVSNIASDDVCYTSRPMAYVGGYPIFYIGIGATLISADVGFLNHPANKDFVEGIWEKEGCSIIFMVPQNLKSLRDNGFRVRSIISGGDLITKEMIQNAFVFTDAFALVYGSTETILSTHEIFTMENISEHQQGMIGTPIPGTELKIINDKEEVVEMGEVGMLCIRSAWNTKCYDGNQMAPLKNRWFHTNDICYMQPNGKILMKGRKSGFIIKGTVNVSIYLIEDYVGSHPNVEQVVVVGIPDPQYGEDICACVRITSGRSFDEETLRAYCDKKLSSKSSLDWISMVPSYFLSFDAFPTLLNGKLDRDKVKNMAIQRVKHLLRTERKAEK